MAKLRAPQAEADAQRVAQTWLEHGKEKAAFIYRQTVQREKMMCWEVAVFSARVYEILHWSGVTYTIADGVNKAREMVLPKGV